MPRDKCPPHADGPSRVQHAGGKRWVIVYCAKCGQQIRQWVEAS
ncbi:MAG: hypothetical protein ACRDQA_11430 [Nocardioidaceae bacterium]